MEAEANGYSEGIALDTFGYVSEGMDVALGIRPGDVMRSVDIEEQRRG